MARGSVHALATLLVGANGCLQVPTNGAGLAWGIGTLLATIITPDNDLIYESGGNYSMTVLSETFRKFPKVSFLVQKGWMAIWYFYSKALSHRSWVSHAPIISTLIRLAYMLPFTLALWWLLGSDFQYVVLAMICADVLHFILDLKIWRILNLFTQ